MDFVCVISNSSLSVYLPRVPNHIMPPKSKVTTRSAKKGKAGKKKVTAVVNTDHESDWTSGNEEPSMRDMVQNLTAMMASLNI